MVSVTTGLVAGGGAIGEPVAGVTFGAGPDTVPGVVTGMDEEIPLLLGGAAGDATGAGAGVDAGVSREAAR